MLHRLAHRVIHIVVNPATGGRAKAWCLLIHEEASLSLSVSVSTLPRKILDIL